MGESNGMVAMPCTDIQKEKKQVGVEVLRNFRFNLTLGCVFGRRLLN